MFLAVIGVPQAYEIDGIERFFDGKIGIYEIAEVRQAIRNSIHRPRGADVITPVSLDSEKYYQMMTRPGGVIESIKQKMPWMVGREIVVQHDGAPVHEGRGNLLRLNEAGHRDGWLISFQKQPPQSPDLNKLDLCLFNSLQKRSDEIRDVNERINGIPGIIEAVRHCWEEYEHGALSRVHALQHAIFRAVLENDGGNQYDIPHTRINWRQRHGENPLDRIVPPALFNKAQDAIDEILNGADYDDLENDLDDAEEEQVEQEVI
jgi:hypothetical protein